MRESWTSERRVERGVTTSERWADPEWKDRVLRVRAESAKRKAATLHALPLMMEAGKACRFVKGDPRVHGVDRPDVSERFKALWADPEWRASALSARKASEKEQRRLERCKSEEWRELKRDSSRAAWTEGRMPNPGKKRYEHLDASGRLWRFRSSWEVAFARYLDERGVRWFFEPTRILLSDGRIYIPDFWVEDWQCFCEVKGWRGRRNSDKPDVARADGHRIITVKDITRSDAELRAALLPQNGNKQSRTLAGMKEDN